MRRVAMSVDAALAMGEESAVVEPAEPEYLRIPLDRIVRNPHNRRKIREDSKHIQEMVDSIRKYGVQEPALVRPTLPGFYELVSGECRFTASRLAGKGYLPCLVRPMSDDEAFAILIIENKDRKDLNCLEEADTYAEAASLGWTVDDIVSKCGKSRTHVARRMKLVDLSPRWRDAVTDEKHPLSGWLPGQFELIARFDPAVQDSIFDAALPKGSPWNLERVAKWTSSDLKGFLANYLLALSGARWKVSDEYLIPDAGSCDACMKRSDRQPELFDVEETGKSKNGPAACCLDKPCWDRKLQAFLLSKEAELREKYGAVTLLGWSRDAVGTPWEGKVKSKYDVLTCKKGDPWALPALEVTGDDAGKVVWVKKKSERSASGAAAASEAGPKPLAERKRVWEKRRQKIVLGKAMEHLGNLAEGKIDIPSSFDASTCLALISITGTKESFRGWHGSVQEKDFWTRMQERLEWPLEKMAKFYLRESARVLQEWTRVDLNSLQYSTPNMGLLKRLSPIVGFGYDDVYAEAVAATPYPKSWAGLGADGKPKKAEKKGGAEKKDRKKTKVDAPSTSTPGVCRECGCTEDNACEDEDGTCYWVDKEKTLCSACCRKHASGDPDVIEPPAKKSSKKKGEKKTKKDV
jgi:ParB/RepB/Spo0J family partition protein